MRLESASLKLASLIRDLEIRFARGIHAVVSCRYLG
jgi:hypothetical protein